MEIYCADIRDIVELLRYDKHIAKSELENSIRQGRVYIAREKETGNFIGWLRYGMFWDSIPFMNMLYLFEDWRGKGIGKKLTEHWEEEMRERGYKSVMTSTQSNEYAQHFYVKLGYKSIGGFMLDTEPYELILVKNLI